MFYGYDKAKQVSKGNRERPSLIELNQHSKKYFQKEFTKKEILAIVRLIASGRISNPMNYIPFKKVIEKYPNQKSILLKHAHGLFDQFISFTFQENRTLYTNAYVCKKSMPYYHQLIRNLKLNHVSISLKQMSEELDPMKEDQNIWKCLEHKHQEILTSYGLKDQIVTKNQILFAKTYETIYQNELSPHHQLLEEFEIFLKEKKIKHIEVCKNEIYNMMKSYTLYFEEQLNCHEIISREMLSKMEHLYKQMKTLFGEAEFVIQFHQLLQKIKDYNVVFTVETYDDTKESFQAFCSRHQLSYQTILTRLERTKEVYLLEQVKGWLEETKRIEKIEEEKMLQHFVYTLTQIVKMPDAFTSFTLAHYYALTSTPLDHMVRYLEQQGYQELHQFLFRFYCHHLHDEKSYKKVNINLDADVVTLVKSQLTRQHFPKKIGLFYQAYEMFEHHALSYFTKEYFVVDLKNWLAEKEEKAKQKVQN